MAHVDGRRLVLLAEDDTDQAFLARKMLERQGFIVVTALDGEQALSLFEVIKPSAVVLDLVMPGIDGFEVLKAIRGRPGPRPTVLAVSSLRGYLPKAKELGADDALRKPYSARLVERLQSLLGNGASESLPSPEGDGLGPHRESPKDEELLRSKTTKDVLDLIGGVGSQPDPLLQDLTERTARLFDVRACVVSLVTRDHDFWAAGCGVPGAPGRVAARETSVCSHAISSRAAIVVHDAEENPFFRDSEARGMGIRFYAGVPLISRMGEPLGSLCLLDHRPRDFSWIDLELLGRIASAVVGSIEWKERAAHPEEPVSTFRHLDTVDPDLRILGRDGFNDIVRHLADRAAEYPDDSEDQLCLLVVESPSSSLEKVVARLRESYPVAMLGRLSGNRVGVAVLGGDKENVQRLASRVLAPGTRLLADAPGCGSLSAMEALRQMEARLTAEGNRSREKDSELHTSLPA